ncbi:acyl-CoA dehydrogenase family protein [Sphaerisporangium sp. TRM90804]|uniref:acyl-CoA dehydrogenase family protein n=1 Tax=Sphaerisporangium sp. TRM90804 TaxID=3031113 RepID=UPI00244AAF86|nr:acyl-CoA dehydrogenase family protein [Sphaerisporangium sp. TRM90804]MDH2430800.1 acyl-CoA dehydrogenase family protein [Sphaerisporangium sp. TRM90804]
MTVVMPGESGGTIGRPDDAKELLDRARELVPLLRANAPQTERDMRPVADNLEALRKAGLFRLTTPVRYGGHDLSLPDLLKIIFEVGRGCASTGWIVANDAASTSFTLTFPEAALDDMYAGNPDVLVLSTSNLSGAKAVRVDGGHTISGRFPWSSGSEFSDWVFMGPVFVFDGEQPGALMFGLVPIDQVTVEKTWSCAGMSGTGTHTIVATDLFIPDYRTLVYDLSGENQPGEDDRGTDVIKGSLQSLAALVGAAQGALDTTREILAKGRPITFTTYTSSADSPAVQLRFAEAAHLIDTAVLHMLHAGEALDGIDPAAPVPWVERSRVRAHMASALGRAREGVDKLLDVAGASGFALSNPLQRYWRDLNVGSRHNSLNAPIIFEDYSRALLDIRPSVTWIH